MPKDRPAASRPLSQHGRATTPSFVCEVPLRVTAADEAALLTRFEAARQPYNAVLGEALRRLRLLQQSRAYHAARSLPRTAGRERTAAFRAARLAGGSTEYSAGA